MSVSLPPPIDSHQVCGLLGALAVSAMTAILPYALAFAAGAMVYVLHVVG